MSFNSETNINVNKNSINTIEKTNIEEQDKLIKNSTVKINWKGRTVAVVLMSIASIAALITVALFVIAMVSIIPALPFGIIEISGAVNPYIIADFARWGITNPHSLSLGLILLFSPAILFLSCFPPGVISLGTGALSIKLWNDSSNPATT